MYLINTETLTREDFVEREKPRYAILSHRWRGEELSFDDMSFQSIETLAGAGLTKLQACCAEAKHDNISYIWIDTCCIDKRSSAMLSEAINSMFSWYAEAEVCYAYLDDALSLDDIGKSEWFTRGWTLQELLAPREVLFFGAQWHQLGTRSALSSHISYATRIDKSALLKAYNPMSTRFSVAQRMSWAANRLTTRPEDMAYSLMGLFNINMPLLYGEGGSKAFVRLQQEIIKISDDQSIFAWSSQQQGYRGLLATSPQFFNNSRDIVVPDDPEDDAHDATAFTITNKGLSIALRFQVHRRALDTYAVRLDCIIHGQGYVLIFLEFTYPRKFRACARVMVDGRDIAYGYLDHDWITLKVHVPQYELVPCRLPTKVHGFEVYHDTPSKRNSSVHGDIYQHGDLIGSAALPSQTVGTVGTFIIPSSEKLAAIRLGFDSNFHPVCRLFDAPFSTALMTELEKSGNDWIDEDIGKQPGAVAVGPYRILREKENWYFGIPLQHGECRVWKGNVLYFTDESEAVHPVTYEPSLNVIISACNFEIHIERQLKHDRLSWYVYIRETVVNHPLYRPPTGSSVFIHCDQKIPVWRESPIREWRNRRRQGLDILAGRANSRHRQSTRSRGIAVLQNCTTLAWN